MEQYVAIETIYKPFGQVLIGEVLLFSSEADAASYASIHERTVGSAQIVYWIRRIR